MQSLLEAALPKDFAATHPHDSELPFLCHAKRACFWFFAREDYLTAYSKMSRTRLDPHRIEIWESAGLEFNTDGLPNCSKLESSKASGDCPAARFDLVSNILIWILCDIVNLQVMVADSTLIPSTKQETELAFRWQQLWHTLDILHGSLPMEFEPYASVMHPMSSDTSSEVYFSKASSAATMQHYHFARLQLLSSPVCSVPSVRDGATHQVLPSRLKRHAQEIVSIAAGCSDAAARHLMVHPLYMAGTLLEAQNERNAVIQHLQNIQADLGCRTDYRIEQLLSYWLRDSSGET